jgi:hypothetical protein
VVKCNATPEREKKSRKTQLVVESFALLLLVRRRVVPPVKSLDIFLSVFLFPEIKNTRRRRRRRRPHEREEREDALEAEEKRGGF